MRNSFWILNSFLLMILLAVGLFLWTTRPHLPQPSDLRKPLSPHNPVANKESFNIQSIVERNIFNTQSRLTSEGQPDFPQLPPEMIIPPFPHPPRMRPLTAYRATPPTILPPLDVNVKGIMTSEAEEDNRAILSDGKSKQEDLYQVGDTILDAEIIRILSNKIIFARPNGQLETVFLSPLDAQHDYEFQAASQQRKERFVRALDATHFQLDPTIFRTHIANLAQFIDQLDITTALQNGKNIGCKIGEFTSESAGAQFGLQLGDIVTHINDHPLRSTAERLEAYRSVTGPAHPPAISVRLMRKGQPLIFTYTLGPLTSLHKKLDAIHGEKSADESSSFYQKTGAAAGILKEFHNEAKAAMLEYGGKAYANAQAEPSTTLSAPVSKP